MVSKANGQRGKLNLKSIIGYTDTETVKPDFDSTPFKEVKYWALRTMEWFKLEGFIILKSSESNYHVVFNRPVTWTENTHIVARAVIALQFLLFAI